MSNFAKGFHRHDDHHCGEPWIELEGGSRFCSTCMVIECPGCTAEVPFQLHANTPPEFMQTGIVRVVPIVAEHHCPVPKAA